MDWADELAKLANDDMAGFERLSDRIQAALAEQAAAGHAEQAEKEAARAAEVKPTPDALHSGALPQPMVLEVPDLHLVTLDELRAAEQAMESLRLEIHLHEGETLTFRSEDVPGLRQAALRLVVRELRRSGRLSAFLPSAPAIAEETHATAEGGARHDSPRAGHSYGGKPRLGPPARPPPIALLHRLGVNVPAGITRNEASRLIDTAKTHQARPKPSGEAARECAVPWCDAPSIEPTPAEHAAVDHRALCTRHHDAHKQLRCSECGSPIDQNVRAFSVARVATPLCFAHQRDRGILRVRA